MYQKVGLMVLKGVNELFSIYANVPEDAGQDQPFEVFVDEEFGGARIFSNIMITAPVTVKDEVMLKAMQHFECNGIIYSSDALITIKDDVAEIRRYTNLPAVIDKIKFDLDAELDDFDPDDVV